MIILELPTIVKEGIKEANRILNLKKESSYNQVKVIKDSENPYNILYHGDNIYAIIDLLNKGYKNSIDLIYIDPPFFTMDNYNNKVQVNYNGDKVNIEYLAYKDTWKDGFKEYLIMMVIRLYLMKELLSHKGTIYIHLDYRSVHYIKIIMDYIFGEERFLNEIIWAYKSGGTSNKYFSRKHDNILVYSKTKDYIFNPQKEKSYNRNYKPYRFKGVKEYKDELGWHTLVNLKDVWNIDMVGRTSRERVGYDTQKPETLLERIIMSSSNESSIIADLFAGSGTTLKVAEKLNRQFVGADMGNSSILTINKRLDKSFTLISSPINWNMKNFTYDLDTDKVDEEYYKIEIKLNKYDIELDKLNLNKKNTNIIEDILQYEPMDLIDYIGIGIKEDSPYIFYEEYRNVNTYKINTKISCFHRLDNQKDEFFIKIIDVFGNAAYNTFKII